MSTCDLSEFLRPITLPDPAATSFLGRRSLGRRPLGSCDVEDGADAQEEAPEDGPQLGDQVKLHHFTQVGVVAGGMGLELEKKGKDVN